ncbi:hypothetical protein GCM10009795_026060 [Nocardioides hankookensis]|uniref:Bacterial Ig-like domain-containing protein n=1 Tax=Nocardioides hankookensis TaxID=443157 RepID=A0ABW1LCE1_9ACTN
MRTTTARLAGVLAGLSLIATPLVVAAPSHADTGEGTVTVNIVDDRGQPVKAVVQLIDSTGGNEILGDPTTPASSYSMAVPVGGYGVVVMGGWPLMSCFGVTGCDGLGITSPTTLTFASAVVTATEGGSATYTAVLGTPTVEGAARAGETLEVVSPMSGELADAFGDFLAPSVTWLRNGDRIRGAKGAAYTLTRRDVGSRISATIGYPALLKLLAGISGGLLGIAPDAFTSPEVTVTKNTSTTDLKLSGGTAYVRVSGAADEASGWVQLTMKGQRATWARVQDGFVPVDLPNLKAGKYKVTATYQGNGELLGSKDTANLTVKKAKKRKG